MRTPREVVQFELVDRRSDFHGMPREVRVHVDGGALAEVVADFVEALDNGMSTPGSFLRSRVVHVTRAFRGKS